MRFDVLPSIVLGFGMTCFYCYVIYSKRRLTSRDDEDDTTHLSIDGGARYVWCHGLVWHVPPGMVLWWWLWKPDITTIPYRSEEDSNFLSIEPITLINHSYSLRTSFSVFLYPPSDVFHIPPSWPDSQASFTASTSTIAPRALFTKNAPFFILWIVSLLNIPLSIRKVNPDFFHCKTWWKLVNMLFTNDVQNNRNIFLLLGNKKPTWFCQTGGHW